MDDIIRQGLINEAKKRIATNDPSHDFTHTQRVLENALNIAKKEGGDLDIIIPAALFHDLITYSKNDPRNKYSTDESAKGARKILEDIPDYPEEKIRKVERIILCTSFSKGLKADFLEARIIQDADMLEATGAISIMRTFASSGKMNRPFYNLSDPFAKKRSPNDTACAVDLFYTRLLRVGERMNTKTAKQIAAKRSKFLKLFLDELKRELRGE